MKNEILKISSKSNPNAVAGAIAGMMKETKEVIIQAVGAGAVNQAVKSTVIARGYLAPAGINLICIPAFSEITINNENVTGIKFILKEENIK